MTIEKERVFQYYDVITALGVRRFGQTPLAEEAVLAAIDGLEKNDWQKIREFEGKASFPSYLSVLVLRLFEDFSRKRFGRVRPPAWVTRLGGIWTRLFSALCLERNDVTTAVELVYQRLAGSDGNAGNHEDMKAEKAAIEDAAYTLLGKIPDCGSISVDVPMDEELLTHNGLEEKTGEKREFIETLFHIVLGEEPAFDATKVSDKLKNVKIVLLPEEKLLLKLCYQDGMNVTEAGKMLGLNRFQAHGKMKRLMTRLRVEFQRVGLAADIEDALR